MGCLGMSLQDFCSCTPSEFQKVYEAWRENALRLQREGWEQTRLICVLSIQPYSTKKLDPQVVMPLPWDREEERKEERKMTEEERKERYKAAKKRYGIE